MTMSPGLRKFALAVHLAVSVGWIGGALAYLAVGIAAQTSQDAATIRAAWIIMDLVGWYVIVPLAAAALSTGVLMALGTRWGLFRHYWVLFSLALTTVSAVVLVLHMRTVSSTADVAREAEPAHVEALGGDVLHPAIGVVVLVIVHVLNVYKPRGTTRSGRNVPAAPTRGGK